MIDPERVSTDIYANIAKHEYAGVFATEAVASLGALAYGLTNNETATGQSSLVASGILGVLACRTLAQTLKYARREKEIGPC